MVVYTCGNIDFSIIFFIVHVKKSFQVREVFWNIPVGPEYNLNNVYKNSFHTSQKTHCVRTAETSRLNLFVLEKLLMFITRIIRIT
jgi:hypothetical protein